LARFPDRVLGVPVPGVGLWNEATGSTAAGIVLQSAALVLLVESLGGPLVALLLLAASLAAFSWRGVQGYALPAVASVVLALHYLTLPPLDIPVPARLEFVAQTGFQVTKSLLVGLLLLGIQASERRLRSAARRAGRRSEGLRNGGDQPHPLQESSSQSKERFRLLLAAVTDYAIVMLDAEGRVVSWNEGAERILGYRADDVMDRHVSYFYTEEGVRHGKPAYDLKVAVTEGQYEDEDWRLRKDGSRLWAQVGITALRDETGALRGFATITRDVTGRHRAEEALRRAHDELEARVRERTEELARANAVLQTEVADRKHAEEGLKQAKEAAEEASRAKDQFLAVLSHELRTPLTPVLLSVSAVLEHPPEPAELWPILAMIQRNIALEARLIDDLLDVARASRGQLTMTPRVVDLHAVIREAIEICSSDVSEAGLRLTLSLDATASHAAADPARVQQVFWNLIKNAVKFTPQGGEVSLHTRNEEGPGGAWFLAEVKDTGMGIEPEVLPRLFSPFEQGSPALRGRHGGLGLGLAISRSVIDSHGGRLTASSPGSGLGACFLVELLTTPAPAVPTPALPGPSERDPVRGLRVLLVEDNKDTLKYLSWSMARMGHAVLPALTVAAARELASSDRFDVVVSDIELPDGSGLELMREVRQTWDVPGIAVSGFGSDEDVRMSHDAGFQQHLTKPIDVRALEEALRFAALGADP
jgi:PAS domain S-box-containing protein